MIYDYDKAFLRTTPDVVTRRWYNFFLPVAEKTAWGQLAAKRGIRVAVNRWKLHRDRAWAQRASGINAALRAVAIATLNPPDLAAAHATVNAAHATVNAAHATINAAFGSLQMSMAGLPPADLFLKRGGVVCDVNLNGFDLGRCVVEEMKSGTAQDIPLRSTEMEAEIYRLENARRVAEQVIDSFEIDARAQV